MNRNVAVAVMLASSFGLSTASSAQNQDHTVRVTIPFNFWVNEGQLPAGTYLIYWNTDPRILTVRNVNGRSGLHAMGRPTDATGVTRDLLVFRRYGDQYFLSKISAGNVPLNYAFFPTKAEEKARAQAQAQTQSADAPAAAEVLVALK